MVTLNERAKQSTDLEDFAVCSLQICADLCSWRGLQLIDTSIPLKDIVHLNTFYLTSSWGIQKAKHLLL